MGGFIIALAMEKWNLHRRIAISIISMVGINMDRIVLGFMIATGFLSMWISNTATAMMMIPIGLAIIKQVADNLKDDPTIDTSPQRFAFGKALMLGIAYSASVGGIATLIGTPPNMLPVATPPNAAVFGSGYIKITDMMRAGFALNVFGVILISLSIYFLLPVIWDIDLNSVPEVFKVINQ